MNVLIPAPRFCKGLAVAGSRPPALGLSLRVGAEKRLSWRKFTFLPAFGAENGPFWASNRFKNRQIAGYVGKTHD